MQAICGTSRAQYFLESQVILVYFENNLYLPAVDCQPCCVLHTSIFCFHFALHVRYLVVLILRSMEEARICLNKWIKERENTVRLLRKLANQIQAVEDANRKAKVAGNFVGYFGSVLAIASTFAGLPPLALVGTAIASGGGLAAAITELASRISELQGAKLVDKALEKDKKAIATFFEEIARIVEKGKRLVPGDAGYEWLKVARCAGKFGYDAYQAGHAMATGTAEAVGEFGIAVSGVFAVLNVYTIVKTSAEINKGDVLKVVQDIRSKAQELQNEIQYYKKKVSTLFTSQEPSFMVKLIVWLLFVCGMYYIWYYIL